MFDLLCGRVGRLMAAGLYEFVKKGDPPVMGITKVGVNGITAEDLKRPRRKLPLEQTAARLLATV